MLYDGPWCNDIVALESSTKALFAGFVFATSEKVAGLEGHGEWLPALLSACEAADDTRRHGAFGILADGRIEAALLYCIPQKNIAARRPRVMHFAITVAGGQRHRGMATALMSRCITHGRAMGVQSLVLSDVSYDAASRRLARRFGADLIFVNGECQAWIELWLPTTSNRSVEVIIPLL